MSSAQSAIQIPPWTSPLHFRLLLSVEPAHSPATLEIDWQEILRQKGSAGRFDVRSLEVVGLDSRGRRRPFPNPQKKGTFLIPHRLDTLMGSSRSTLHVATPDPTWTNLAVYFDTIESRLGQPQRYSGIVGDGDKFREVFGKREIAGSHFDQWVDFDGDGDLDLFKGGVEPFVHCFENIGGNQLVDRGRLSSGGALFTLPKSRSNRSWVTIAFYDIDGDGDQDFFPSFGDGPDSGKIIFYRNTTREHGGQLAFDRVGPLTAVSGTPLAGGPQAGGWFPSITFVADWDADGIGPDALVGSNNRCWLHRNLGTNSDGSPRFTDPVAVRADGKEIELVNPRFDVADIDGDGDLDLFAATQAGAVMYFENEGTRSAPRFKAGVIVAWDGRYLIGDAHSGVKLADLDGDGRLDLLSGRFWERADLNHADAPRDFGGYWKNNGSSRSPRFQRRPAPFTMDLQVCDAVRQNSLRAVDWDGDGKLDLLAGDTDGSIWYFRNRGTQFFPEFEARGRLQAGRSALSVSGSGGHARLDLCDWNNDGRQDLLVADGSGNITLFLNHGTKTRPAVSAGQPLLADGKPIHVGSRASVLACDWNNDGRKDLLLADERGYYICRNQGTDAVPILDPPSPILFGGKPVKYVRPNLGSFVDWDGDGKRDLIGCNFENNIRLHRNMGSGERGADPEFDDPEGTVLVRGESPQMISGADAVDWNGDGAIDLLTGQGHGGSGLRFFDRHWIEDQLHGKHPAIKILAAELKR